MNVVIVDDNGNIIRNDCIDGTNLHIGYSYIATNGSGLGTGFLITWRDHSIGPHRARLVYVPVNTSKDIIGPKDVYFGGGSWHGVPIAIWNKVNNTWVVVYGHQTKSYRPRIFVNVLDMSLRYVGGSSARYLSPSGGGNKTGYDVWGGLIYDFVTNKLVFIARNESSVGNYDIEMFSLRADGPLATLSRLSVDNRPGAQGPSPSMFNATFTRFLLYPMYTELLGSGEMILTVYNSTSSTLTYAVINLQTGEVLRRDLINIGESTTIYPWVASNETHWLVAWNALNKVNLSIVDSSGFDSGILTLADKQASFVKVAYDAGSGKFIIPYAVNELGDGRRNLVVAFYNAVDSVLEPWVLPVGMNSGTHDTPLDVEILGGGVSSPGKIAIIALEGDKLVVYLVGSEYPELQNPLPIPEPAWVVIPVIVVTTFFVLRSLKPKKD